MSGKMKTPGRLLCECIQARVAAVYGDFRKFILWDWVFASIEDKQILEDAAKIFRSNFVHDFGEWRPIETAPKTEMPESGPWIAHYILAWCVDESAPDGGDITVIWWEPLLGRIDQKTGRKIIGIWYNGSFPVYPSHWMPLPGKPLIDSTEIKAE